MIKSKGKSSLHVTSGKGQHTLPKSRFELQNSTAEHMQMAEGKILGEMRANELAEKMNELKRKAAMKDKIQVEKKILKDVILSHFSILNLDKVKQFLRDNNVSLDEDLMSEGEEELTNAKFQKARDEGTLLKEAREKNSELIRMFYEEFKSDEEFVDKQIRYLKSKKKFDFDLSRYNQEKLTLFKQRQEEANQKKEELKEQFQAKQQDFLRQCSSETNIRPSTGNPRKYIKENTKLKQSISNFRQQNRSKKIMSFQEAAQNISIQHKFIAKKLKIIG